MPFGMQHEDSLVENFRLALMAESGPVPHITEDAVTHAPVAALEFPGVRREILQQRRARLWNSISWIAAAVCVVSLLYVLGHALGDYPSTRIAPDEVLGAAITIVSVFLCTFAYRRSR